jgi:hypothetical protein
MVLFGERLVELLYRMYKCIEKLFDRMIIVIHQDVN